MPEELKPCPFCGGKANLAISEDINIHRMVRLCNLVCNTCGASSPVIQVESSPSFQSYATKDWNTRPIEDALRARIAELEAKNRGLSAQKDGATNALKRALDEFRAYRDHAAIDTHYEGCWEYHYGCAMERIKKLEKDIGELILANCILKADLEAVRCADCAPAPQPGDSGVGEG